MARPAFVWIASGLLSLVGLCHYALAAAPGGGAEYHEPGTHTARTLEFPNLKDKKEVITRLTKDYLPSLCGEVVTDVKWLRK